MSINRGIRPTSRPPPKLEILQIKYNLAATSYPTSLQSLCRPVGIDIPRTQQLSSFQVEMSFGAAPPHRQVATTGEGGTWKKLLSLHERCLQKSTCTGIKDVPTGT